jgi:hypothetical protein
MSVSKLELNDYVGAHFVIEIFRLPFWHCIVVEFPQRTRQLRTGNKPVMLTEQISLSGIVTSNR